MDIVVKNTENHFPSLKAIADKTLQNLSLPGAKDEDWKYTKVAKLSKKSFVVENDTRTKTLNDISYYPKSTSRIVFENGFYRENLSFNSSKYLKRIAELTEQDLQDKLTQTGYIKEGIFTSSNDAFFSDGVLIEIPKKTSAEGLIEIVFISNGKEQASVVKNIFIAHEGSEAEILLNFQAHNAVDNLVNHALHVSVHTNAKLIVYKLQQETSGVSHFSNENIFQETESKFEIHTITLEGDLVRNDLNINVNGQHCYSHLGGVFIATGNMHVDNHTMVDHRVANCESNEQYKGIATDKGTGVFNGKIFVRRDAQKINAYQNSANVLLSDDANIYTKPELEIYADDVKCSHGTTTGCLDDNALFYLRARGLSEDSARRLLVEAFAADVIEKVENDAMREWILEKLNVKLQQL